MKIRILTSLICLTGLFTSCHSQTDITNKLIDEEVFELSRIDYKDIIIKKTLSIKKSLYTQSNVQRKAYYDGKSDMFFRTLDSYFGISCLISLETYLDVKELRKDFLQNDIQLFISSNGKETVEIKDKRQFYFRVSIVPKSNIEKIFNIYRIESNDGNLKTIDIYNFYTNLERKYKISFIGIGSGWIYVTVDNKNDFEKVVKEIKSFSPMMAGYEMEYLLKRFEKEGVIEILF